VEINVKSFKHIEEWR